MKSEERVRIVLEGVHEDGLAFPAQIFQRFIAADLDAAKQFLPKGTRASICVCCINRILKDADEQALLEDAKTVLEWMEK